MKSKKENLESKINAKDTSSNKKEKSKTKNRCEYSDIVKVYLVGGMVDVKSGGSIWRKNVEEKLIEIGGYKVINPIEAESHLDLIIDRDNYENFGDYVLAWENLKATDPDMFRYGKGKKGGFRAIADFNYEVVDESHVIVCHYDDHIGHGSISEMALNYFLEEHSGGVIKPTYLEKPILIHSTVNLKDTKNKKGKIIEKGMNERDVAHSTKVFWNWGTLYDELEEFKKRHIAKQRVLKKNKFRTRSDSILALKRRIIKKETKLKEDLRKNLKGYYD